MSFAKAQRKLQNYFKTLRLCALSDACTQASGREKNVFDFVAKYY